MYTLFPFYERLCYFSKRYFNTKLYDCKSTYSIWDIDLVYCWRVFAGFFTTKLVASSPWFPLIYWSVLVMSLLGLRRSVNEFKSIYLCPCGGALTLWRERKFYFFSGLTLRRCRLFGAGFMINMWASLVYGIVTVTPQCLKPWLGITAILLSAEVLAWMCEILWGCTKVKLHTVFSFILMSFSFFAVYTVHNVFEMEVASGGTESLRLVSFKL